MTSRILIFLLLFATDALALNPVKFAPDYIPEATRSRALSSASIYVGNPNTDPTVLVNQKELSVVQENGSVVAVTQPINTNAGGIPIYNGSPVQLVVDGDYSMTVLDSYGDQVYYTPYDASFSFLPENISVFDTLALMGAETLSEGAIYRVKGTLSAGDGAGGLYLIKTLAAYGGLPVASRDLLVNSGSHVAVLQTNRVVDTIAGLRNTVPVEGLLYQTRYRNVQGDAGGLFFNFVADGAPGTYTDNEGTIIVPNGGDGSGAFIAQLSDSIDPLIFGAVGDAGTTDDLTALNAALAFSVTSKLPVLFQGDYTISDTLHIPAGAYTLSTQSATLRELSGSELADGVIFDSGNNPGYYQLPTLTGFDGVALSVRSILVDIYVARILFSGVAVQFETGASGSTSNVLDSKVMFETISSATTAVKYLQVFDADTIKNCGVVGKFITGITNGVIFEGPAAAVRTGNFIKVEDVNLTGGGGGFLVNNTGATINRFTAAVSSRFNGGGFTDVSPTQIATGQWLDCDINLNSEITFDQTNQANGLLVGCKIKLRKQIDILSAKPLVLDTDTIAEFDSGTMEYSTDAIYSIELQASLASLGAREFSFYHIFADANYPQWQVQVVTDSQLSFQSVIDKSDVEDGKVDLRFRNNTGGLLPIGTTAVVAVKRAY